MKLHYFANEKHLFDSEGDVPLVGQTVYFYDHTIPGVNKKKYKVVRADRSVSISIRDMRSIDLKSKLANDRYFEAIEMIEKESEGGRVVGVAFPGPSFKVSRDIAEIHLVIDSVTIQPYIESNE